MIQPKDFRFYMKSILYECIKKFELRIIYFIGMKIRLRFKINGIGNLHNFTFFRLSNFWLGNNTFMQKSHTY